MGRKGGRQHNSILRRRVTIASQTILAGAIVSMMETWRHVASHADVLVLLHLVDHLEVMPGLVANYVVWHLIFNPRCFPASQANSCSVQWHEISLC